jgi:hypothetical protein
MRIHGERRRKLSIFKIKFEKEKITQVYTLQSSEKEFKVYSSKQPLQDNLGGWRA